MIRSILETDKPPAARVAGAVLSCGSVRTTLRRPGRPRGRCHS
jgi:hypothetical protein